MSASQMFKTFSFFKLIRPNFGLLRLIRIISDSPRTTRTHRSAINPNNQKLCFEHTKNAAWVTSKRQTTDVDDVDDDVDDVDDDRQTKRNIVFEN